MPCNAQLVSPKITQTKSFVSLINPISGIKFLNDFDSETYSASVEDRSMNVCSLESQTIGHLA